jgi:lipopolysaccharide exporter
MSLAQKTVRGSAWIIATSIGARVIGVVGTLVLTRFLVPAAYGEVQAASVVAATASQLSTLGVGQYLIANPKSGREIAFHATFFHLAVGFVALLATYLLRGPIADLVGTPGLVAFVPGLILSVLLDRVGFMPERVLVRDMRFRTLAGARTASEIVYTAVSIVLAVLGWGAMAVVLGNVARSLSKMILMMAAVDRRDWLLPCRLQWTKTKELFNFGLPLSLGASASFASRRWDNLVVSALFGPAALGAYNLAYNLADIPAVQVGEQISDVLLPSFARLEPEKRPMALVRALSLLSLIMAPLAIGLGAIAPTLVRALFDPRWSAVAPMLAVLSALSVTRPIGGAIWSYLQARQMPRSAMGLEISKLILLLGVMLTLGRLGPIWACVAVGVAFLLHTAASLWLVDRTENLPLRRLVVGMLGPVVASVPMCLAVLGVRQAMAGMGLGNAFLGVVLETLAGAIAYVPAALLLAPTVSRDFVGLIRMAAHNKKTKIVEAPAAA